MSDNEERLKGALQRLEVSTQKIIKTRGYVQDAKSLKVLEETIREQLTHANIRSATRSIR
jgi:hypothetical protein